MSGATSGWGRRPAVKGRLAVAVKNCRFEAGPITAVMWPVVGRDFLSPGGWEDTAGQGVLTLRPLWLMFGGPRPWGPGAPTTAKGRQRCG